MVGGDLMKELGGCGFWVGCFVSILQGSHLLSLGTG